MLKKWNTNLPSDYVYASDGATLALLKSASLRHQDSKKRDQMNTCTPAQERENGHVAT